MRQAQHLSLHKPVEFPLTLGRDFCGEIIAKGVDVNDDLNIGDTVMGVVPPFRQGCHAELVTVPVGLVWCERVYFVLERAWMHPNISCYNFVGNQKTGSFD